MCIVRIEKQAFYKARLLVLFILTVVNVHATSPEIKGCTDPLSLNYNPNATLNDGSCAYAVSSVTPSFSYSLPSNISETSGLIYWDNYLWTHNDDSDTKLYAIDPLNGNIVKNYTLNGISNIDWEDIAQDENYIYIGDFGNNSNGNRTNLKILRVAKSSLLNNTPLVEIINFSYSNQTSFTPLGANQTDFDCESFIVTADSIYLFTKQWLSENTSVYSLSKNPGTHTAYFKTKYNVDGLITGATSIHNKKIIALSGYTSTLAPFIYLLYDYTGTDFFSGNKRKIAIEKSFFQLEGITTSNGFNYYITNEHFVMPPIINVAQSISSLDMSPYLNGYLNKLTEMKSTPATSEIRIYQNTSSSQFSICIEPELPVNISIINALGVTVAKLDKASISDPIIQVENLNLRQGLYIVNIKTKSRVFSQKLTINR